MQRLPARIPRDAATTRSIRECEAPFAQRSGPPFRPQPMLWQSPCTRELFHNTHWNCRYRALTSMRLDPAFRQGGEELATVALGADAFVHDHHNAAIIAAADQATESLFKFEHGLWYLKFIERVATGIANRVYPRRGQRPIRRRKGQLGNDDVFERLTRHVDALPE